MYASQLDNDAIIDYLLQQEDTNVNQQDYDDGWTAFMHSIKSNKHKSVERLLASAKCSIDVQSWVSGC